MKVNPRLIIFILVILAVGVIYVVPYLNPGNDSPESGQMSGQFSTTDKPGEKLQQALNQGRPVFLEFYAKW